MKKLFWHAKGKDMVTKSPLFADLHLRINKQWDGFVVTLRRDDQPWKGLNGTLFSGTDLEEVKGKAEEMYGWPNSFDTAKESVKRLVERNKQLCVPGGTAFKGPMMSLSEYVGPHYAYEEDFESEALTHLNEMRQDKDQQLDLAKRCTNVIRIKQRPDIVMLHNPETPYEMVAVDSQNKEILGFSCLVGIAATDAGKGRGVGAEMYYAFCLAGFDATASFYTRSGFKTRVHAHALMVNRLSEGLGGDARPSFSGYINAAGAYRLREPYTQAKHNENNKDEILAAFKDMKDKFASISQSMPPDYVEQVRKAAGIEQLEKVLKTPGNEQEPDEPQEDLSWAS